VRPFTRLVLIILFALIVAAAIAQFTMRPDQPYPGPVLGTPYPSMSPAP
jgi:hypothetical protein